jgi:hypothetical protein
MTTTDIRLCTCGHTYEQHGTTSRRCLACIKCDRPHTHDPHAAERCACTEYTPTVATCPVCGLLPGVGGDLCHQCAEIAKVTQ